MAQAAFIEVQKALGGISYPATKDQLIEHARGKNAGRDILPYSRTSPTRSTTGRTRGGRGG
jgi:hypothetical protein